MNALTKKDQKGFTLIELAIVILIIGILAAGFAQGFHIYLAKKKLETTDTNISEVRAALSEYIKNKINTNNSGPVDQVRFPCPAGLTIAEGAPNYGIESPGVDCRTLSGTITTSGPVAGVPGVWAIDSQVAPASVLIGGVPTGTLGIPGKYAYDGYGNRLVYAVTLGLTQNNVFLLSQNAIPQDSVSIEVVDRAAGTTTTSSSSFVLFSPGQEKEGAYSSSGIISRPCGTGSDSQNCSWQANQSNAFAGTFRAERKFYLSRAVAGNYYDDKIEYSLGSNDDDRWWGETVINSGIDIFNKANRDNIIIRGTQNRSQLIVNQTGGPFVENENQGVGGSLVVLAGLGTVGNSGPSIDFLSGDGSIAGSTRWYLGNPEGNGNDRFFIRYTPAGGAQADVATITEAGDIGIGITAPSTKLDVAGPVRPGNQNVSGACTSAKAGAVRYNSSSNSMEYCNGSIPDWRGIGISGVSIPVGGFQKFYQEETGGYLFCSGGWGQGSSCSCPSGTSTVIVATGHDFRAGCGTVSYLPSAPGSCHTEQYLCIKSF